MGPYYYTVSKIDGDYALLFRTDVEDNEGITVARALLPEDIDEGSSLVWENLTYTMV